MKNPVLIYDSAKSDYVKDNLMALFEGKVQESVALKPGDVLSLPSGAELILYLNDALLKEILQMGFEKSWVFGLLPHPGLIHGRKQFGISDDLNEAIHDIMSATKSQPMDLMYCNEHIVLNMVLLGETTSITSGGFYANKRFARFSSFFNVVRKIGSLQSKPFTLVYRDKDKKPLQTSALGMVAVQHGKNSLLSRKILDDSVVNDGMLHLIVLSPRSVSELLNFLFKSFFNRNPFQIVAGYIKTRWIKIENKSGVEFTIDGNLLSSKEVILSIQSRAISFFPGRHLKMSNDLISPKESFRTRELPVGETRSELISRKLPWIRHASTEEFKDLLTVLRENATTSSSYLTLMVLSTLLATLGLFANSTPVVIGAMILAPLMAPIISLSMGILRQDRKLSFDSLMTIAYGLLPAFFCAYVLTLVTPLNTANSEILARVKPNLLDLGVAVVSGIAGAYAHAREEVAKTLAGVAIAVALVPPLAVSGIGLGWGDFSVFSGAFLLLLTNLAGIVLAGAVTFLLLGFSAFKLARRGIFLVFIFVALLSLPLGFGFSRMVKEHKIITALDGWEAEGTMLREVKINRMDPLVISLKIVSDKPIYEEELDDIKNLIEKRLGRDVELEITVGIRR
ncbi:MAG: TIGR00341 family protein [Cyclobacteriaceae bacterium]|nr:TIGR00341 family protein [Cyclobacteriaceae bacterium]